MTRISLSLAFNLLVALGLGAVLVWLAIDRVHLRYDMRRLSGKRAELTALVDKLEIERNNMISPNNLRRMAERYNLRPILSGQMRGVGDPIAIAGTQPVQIVGKAAGAKPAVKAAVGGAKQLATSQADKKTVAHVKDARKGKSNP